MNEEIRVLIADDHPVFLKGLAQIIREEAKFNVVAEAKNGVSALEKIRELAPDIAILDVSMPELNGFEVARRSPP